MKRFSEINVKVINDNKTIFEGNLVDWLEEFTSSNFSDLIEVIEYILPLLNGKSEVEYEEYYTGKWTIIKTN